jgi:hypothetical protein
VQKALLFLAQNFPPLFTPDLSGKKSVFQFAFKVAELQMPGRRRVTRAAAYERTIN